MIMFVAGAAITTFMALIKAIAAQIAACGEPLRVQLHLICTFRTRSELHAYGSFLHQVTRDPRFISWLHVEIYVSRPDKPQTLMGAHAHIVKNDIQVPAQSKKKSQKNILKRTGTLLMRALSGRTVVDVPVTAVTSVVEKDNNNAIEEKEVGNSGLQRSSLTVSTIHTLDEIESPAKSDDVSVIVESSSPASVSSTGLLLISENPTRVMTYQEHALPTFQDSSADSVSKKLAALDLMTSAFLVAAPLAVYYAMRTVHWEGSSQWCLTAKKKDGWTIFVCQWTYALIPGVLHTIVMLALGYLGILAARKVHMRHHMLRAGNNDIESSAAFGSSVENEKQAVADGNWDEGDVVYSHGRMDVRKIIKTFVDRGVGKKEDGRGLTTVFAGGPEGFLDMVDKQVQKASWTVEFHRETWAP
ncbi:hypothetical protein BGX26_009657 [Mortierella sp. AD094]|nr:hypothetical protein BGX26_009657 [Mortierella sp. AD094]